MPTARRSAAPHPRLVSREPARVRRVVLVLHGGAEHSRAPVRPLAPADLRMRPFARRLWAVGQGDGVAVWRLRYRYQGWNGADADPAADVGRALSAVRSAHGPVPVVLLGHSMGARAALWAAGDPQVVGVVALAPWTPAGDPVDQLAGRAVMLAHGLADTVTDPAESHAYALRAKAVSERVCRFELPGSRHAMLPAAGDWHRLATAFALAALDVRGWPPVIDRALRAPSPAGLRATLPSRR